MRLFLSLSLVLLIIAAVGCSDEPSPTQVAALDEVGPPPQSGIVVRDGFPLGVTWVDAEAGLRVILGVDLDDFCAGVGTFDIVDYQSAYLQDGRIVDLGKGVVQATVWNFLDFDCALFTTMDPAASGRAKIVSIDNDLLGIEEGDRNTNTWAFMAHGGLVGADGERMQFSGHLRQQYSENGTYKVVSQIILK